MFIRRLVATCLLTTLVASGSVSAHAATARSDASLPSYIFALKSKTTKSCATSERVRPDKIWTDWCSGYPQARWEAHPVNPDQPGSAYYLVNVATVNPGPPLCIEAVPGSYEVRIASCNRASNLQWFTWDITQNPTQFISRYDSHGTSTMCLYQQWHGQIGEVRRGDCLGLDDELWYW